jgi:hypothetical protein
MNIHRISGPAQVAASEDVYAEYRHTTGQTVNTTATTVDYNLKIQDSHNAVTTGASWVFTAPRTGTYLVEAGFQVAVQASGQQTSMSLIIDGIVNRVIETHRNNAGSNDDQISTGSASIRLNQGQTVAIGAAYGPGSGTLSVAGNFNWINIQSQ